MMKKILVIEDDRELRSNIRELLENEGYKVESADNGKKGLEKARKNFPDLIVSDIMMPYMDGFELLEELMKDPETSSIPVIFLTAKAEPENLRRGMKLGADDYLFKPFRLSDLLDAIETRLKKKEITDQKIKAIQEQISTKIPHELRTPLVPILGFAEMIDDEDDIAQVKEMAKIIRKNGKKLHQKIEKFLLYNNIVMEEKNIGEKTENKTFTILDESIFFQCFSEIEEKLKPKERVKMIVETSSVQISELNLITVVGELIENGLKYSDENSPVTVVGTNEKDVYKLTITDQGRGMTKKEINSINAFEKFGQQQFTEIGLGLGLTIVKKIINSNNGSFSIKSELNKYTTCEVLIPIN